MRYDEFAGEGLDQALGAIQAAREAVANVDLNSVPPPTSGSSIVVYSSGVPQPGSLAGTANQVSVTQAGTTLTIAFDAGFFLNGYNDAAAIRGRIGCGGIAAADPNDSITPSAGYVQAEAVAVVTELHDLKDKLRAAGVIAP